MNLSALSKLKGAVPVAVSSKVGRGLLVSQKHSPTILFGAGVVGVVATAVLTARATLRFEPVIEKTQSDLASAKSVLEDPKFKDQYSERDYQKDVYTIYALAAKSTVKLYAPAVLVGALSIASLGGSHYILSKRNLGLTAAYAVLDKSFKEYRSRVVSEYGEDKDREFRYETETHKTISETPAGPKEIKTVRVGPDTPSGYARFFDELCPSWSREHEYNLLFLRCQQQYANDLLRARGHIFLNEVYDMLGLDRSTAGSVVGWTINNDGSGDNYVDFGVFNGNNPRARDFVNGREGAILLDFNVDGVIYDKIGRK